MHPTQQVTGEEERSLKAFTTSVEQMGIVGLPFCILTKVSLPHHFPDVV